MTYNHNWVPSPLYPGYVECTYCHRKFLSMYGLDNGPCAVREVEETPEQITFADMFKSPIPWGDLPQGDNSSLWGLTRDEWMDKYKEYLSRLEYSQQIQEEAKKVPSKPRKPKPNIIKSEGGPVIPSKNKEPKITDLDIPLHSAAVAEFLRGLDRHVVGQQEAKEVIGKMYERALAGMQGQDRPLGAVLLLGPTGCGKTHLVESTAGLIHKDLDRVKAHIIKIDCGEFQHSHEIAKLIGSPPGYLGHRETQPLLSQAKLDALGSEECKFSVVLFDEIEKASDAVWKILMGILDRASLTLGDNQRVSFTRTFLFFTSNLAADVISGKGHKIGLETVVTKLDRTKEVKSKILRHFSHEFYNRFDAVVTCHALKRDQFFDVLELELGKVQTQALLTALNNKRSIGHIRYTDAFKHQIASEGFSEEFGARELGRVIKNKLSERLAVLLNEDLFPRQGEALEVDWVEGKVVFRRVVYREARVAA